MARPSELLVSVEIPGSYAVSLTQDARDSFTVRYGLSQEFGLTYAKAAKCFGSAVLHALACAGRLKS